MRKLLIGLTPLLVTAALVAMPALASGATLAYGTCATGTPETKPPCKAGEHFTPFATGTATPVEATIVKHYVIKGALGTIECTTYRATGTVTNANNARKEPVGHTKLKVIFGDCTWTEGELKGCEVADIEGEVTQVVLKENTTKKEYEVETKLYSGFDIKTTGKPTGCPTKDFGDFTGSGIGFQGLSSNELVFTNASGFTFAGSALTITGTEALVTSPGGKPVFIN